MMAVVGEDVWPKVLNLGGHLVQSDVYDDLKISEHYAIIHHLLLLYDSDWAWKLSRMNEGQNYRQVVKYLRLLDVGHLVRAQDDLKNKAKVGRILGLLVEKLEKKYGAAIFQRNRLAMIKPMRTPSGGSDTKHMKNTPKFGGLGKENVGLTNSAVKSHTPNNHITPLLRRVLQPVTPGSATSQGVKLLDGTPLLQGSELLGKQLDRTPPRSTTRTPAQTVRVQSPLSITPEVVSLDREPNNQSPKCASPIMNVGKAMESDDSVNDSVCSERNASMDGSVSSDSTSANAVLTPTRELNMSDVSHDTSHVDSTSYVSPQCQNRVDVGKQFHEENLEKIPEEDEHQELKHVDSEPHQIEQTETLSAVDDKNSPKEGSVGSSVIKEAVHNVEQSPTLNNINTHEKEFAATPENTANPVENTVSPPIENVVAKLDFESSGGWRVDAGNLTSSADLALSPEPTDDQMVEPQVQTVTPSIGRGGVGQQHLDADSLTEKVNNRTVVIEGKTLVKDNNNETRDADSVTITPEPHSRDDDKSSQQEAVSGKSSENGKAKSSSKVKKFFNRIGKAFGRGKDKKEKKKVKK